ncbi:MULTISPECIES: copper amine oxidase N-terminal domain-containing protein [Paenibacillus]|nr:copper amine oxidase N-terminal domain-containing protein [Paenibacillus odorifer]
MRRMKARAKWFIPFVALLLVLAGCQSVGGFDVNKALIGDVDVKSSESSMTFSMNAEPSEGISAEDKEMVDLINSFSLSISNAKLQENGNVSANGTIGYKQLNIPFSLFMDKKTLVFTVEGAKQPFYFPVQGYDEVFAEVGLDLTKAEDLSKLLTKFVVKNLPNPSAISVTPVSEAVYGQQVNMTKLHTEVTGDELPALLKGFLKSISKDTEGFTELVGGLYDYLYPVIKAMDEKASGDYEIPGIGVIPLGDKEAVVTVLHDAAKLAVDALLLVYDNQLDSLYKSTPELKTVLSKDTKLAVDIFVDSGLHVRKQNVDLKVALPGTEDMPLKSFSLKASSQIWNIGGAVTADPISTEGALDVSSGDLTPGETLNNFDPNSNVYRILKDDLGITKRTIVIEPDDEYYYPIVDNNTTYIPLRYFAEDLDAIVEWDTVNRAIIVTDGVYGDKLVFKIGSSEAVINGEKVKLAEPVFVDEYGDAYVSLRLLAEALHATVYVDEDGWITITRK